MLSLVPLNEAVTLNHTPAEFTHFLTTTGRERIHHLREICRLLGRAWTRAYIV